MGIARSWPEPVMDYQVRRCGNPGHTGASNAPGQQEGVERGSTPPHSCLRVS